MESFSELGISDQILKNLEEKNYKKPTPIQAEATPAIIEKKDVVMQSHTGSGKTAAFGIPLVHGVMADVPAVQFLVLVPTRELASQVYSEIKSLTKGTGIRICAVYGGSSMSEQVNALRDGAQIVIGTPGRLLDHLRRRTMSVSVVRAIVLDEADKMLSMGFLPDVQLIFKQLPKRRQTIMSSATFPYSVERLIHAYMTDPVRISTSDGEKAPKEIEHVYCILEAAKKEQTLLAFLEKEQPELSLIFCNTKIEVKSVQLFLNDAHINAEGLSSELSQPQRERALKRLRTGESQHMVCTDLAARGIDIPELSHVFLFSTGGDPETYVHRTGRTGRAGRSGKAISLVSSMDLAGFQQALRVNGIEAREIQVPTEDEILQSRVTRDLKYLESIEYARDADVRDEFVMLAKHISDEQARCLLPLLLEHFRRPEVINPPLAELKAPAPSSDAPEEDGPRDSGYPRRDSNRRDNRYGDRGPQRAGRSDGRRDRPGRNDRRVDRGDRHAPTSRQEAADRPAPAPSDRSDRPAPAPSERRDRPAPAPSERRDRPTYSDRGDRGDRGDRPDRGDRFAPRGPRQFTNVCLALGRQDGLDAMDIQSLLRRQGRARMEDIGEIVMKDHESFIQIGSGSLRDVLQADGKMFRSFEIFISQVPDTTEKPA